MSIKRGDEAFFDASGNQYDFMLAPSGGLGFVTANPVGSKIVGGERSYADFDTPSMIALADFSGGLGQERLDDYTRYADGANIDTRAGKISISPERTLVGTGNPTGVDLQIINHDGYAPGWSVMVGGSGIIFGTTVALPFTTPDSIVELLRIWVPMRTQAAASTITCSLRALYDGIDIATGSLQWHPNVRDGAWVEVYLGKVALDAGATYYLVIGNTSAISVEIYAAALPGAAVWYQTGSTWFSSAYRVPLQFSDPRAGVDAPPKFLLGQGQDNIARMWLYAGSSLYYIAADGTPTICLDGATPKVVTPRLTDACFFAGLAASNSLYLAADGEDVLVFNGSIGSESWGSLLNHPACYLAVYDDVLYLADENTLVGYDGSNYGAAASVGNTTYPIRSLRAWADYLWVGKDDGLYRVSTPVGYPGTGSLTVSKVIDYTPLADPRNFTWLCEHKGDLIYPIVHGLMRYTAGGVLSSFAPEATADQEAIPSRGQYTAAASVMDTLWVAREVPLGDTTSGILAYINGYWHPIINQSGYGDMIRSIAWESGLYDAIPRLWHGRSLQVRYAALPTTTAKLWVEAGIKYHPTGLWESSWIDGGLRTVTKKWLRVEVEAAGIGYQHTATLWYRTSADAAWVSAGAVANGFTDIDLPTALASEMLQLRIALSSNSYESPLISFVGVRYLERFDNVLTYTRVYELSVQQTYRGGTPQLLNLAEQVAQLETLRGALLPLTYYPWWSTTPISVYIMDIAGAERPDVEERVGADAGTIYVTVRLMKV